MIATLTGKVGEKLQELVILEVNGVGYGLYVTAEDYGKLKVGDQAKVYIHEHIRENTHDLFGFCEIETKTLFELLLEVNGVGPKMALNMLSVGSVAEVQSAIAEGDAKFLQAAAGVGKRVAERVVVDLKDKVGLPGDDISSILKSSASFKKDEAVQALISLGYSNDDAIEALRKIDDKLPTQERIKQALRSNK